MELIYYNFDALEISFQGAIPEKTREILLEAKLKARETRHKALATITDHQIPVHVNETGAKGGYAFVFDTGPDRETWFVADSNRTDRWNLRCSVKSQALAIHGYEGVKTNILTFLNQIEAIGAQEDGSMLERVSRFDACFDFKTPEFHPDHKCLIAHNRTKRRFIGGDEFITQGSDINYVRIGKMPNRQVVMYNKVKEVTEKRKDYWWQVWGIDPKEFEEQIWRFELRAGKEELNKWGIRRFSDFEAQAADVLTDIAEKVRYVIPNKNDDNNARWETDPFWIDLQKTIEKGFLDYRSGTERGVLKAIERKKAQNEFKTLIYNLLAPYFYLMEYEPLDFENALKRLFEDLNIEINANFEQFSDKYQKAQDKFVFL